MNIVDCLHNLSKFVVPHLSHPQILLYVLPFFFETIKQSSLEKLSFKLKCVSGISK